jgi:hypothetical protein
MTIGNGFAIEWPRSLVGTSQTEKFNEIKKPFKILTMQLAKKTAFAKAFLYSRSYSDDDDDWTTLTFTELRIKKIPRVSISQSILYLNPITSLEN